MFREGEDSMGKTLNDNFRPVQPLNGRKIYKNFKDEEPEPGTATNLSFSLALMASLLSLFYFLY